MKSYVSSQIKIIVQCCLAMLAGVTDIVFHGLSFKYRGRGGRGGGRGPTWSAESFRAQVGRTRSICYIRTEQNCRGKRRQEEAGRIG